MKSERGSDEIFGLPPQMKLNPSYRLAAARSRSRSDNALRCHSLRSRRFATPRSGISSRSDFIPRKMVGFTTQLCCSVPSGLPNCARGSLAYRFAIPPFSNPTDITVLHHEKKQVEDLLFFVVEMVGFEPMTPTLRT